MSVSDGEPVAVPAVQQLGGKINRLQSEGDPRWILRNLLIPCNAQVLPGRRVLMVEEGFRVTERNLQGKILWEKRPPGVISAQRLRNGDAFIVCYDQLREVDHAGNEIFKIDIKFDNSGGIKAALRTARKLPNGRFTLYKDDQLVQLNANGRQMESHFLDGDGADCNEILDDGHALISSPWRGCLSEFDADGREVHRFEAKGACHGFRLANGHTLVVIEGRKYVELDKNWQRIKETVLMTPAFRVKRRQAPGHGFFVTLDNVSKLVRIG